VAAFEGFSERKNESDKYAFVVNVFPKAQNSRQGVAF